MKHILNGTEITPKNYEDIGFVIDYENPIADILSVSVDSVSLVNEAKAIIENHVFSGLGALEGIPYQIVTDSGQTLEYFVNTKQQCDFEDNSVTVALQKRWNQQLFMNQANGTTFELMASQGVVFPTFDVPYLIIRDNQVEQGLTLAITTFVTGQALYQAIKDLVQTITAVIQASTPNVGVPPSIDLGDIIAMILKIIAQIVYVIALFIAFKKLVDQLKELLFPKIRYFKACKLKDLITIGCNHLGYQFESSVLDSMFNLTILPVPIIKKKKNILEYLQNDLNFSFTKGYPTAMDSIPTLGSAITTALDWFNGRLFCYDGVVRLERRDWINSQFVPSLEPSITLQGTRSDKFRLNTNEVWKRQYVHYMTDQNDFHTMNEFDNTDCEDSTEPITFANKDLLLIQGYKDVSIPFALGSRKNKLTWVEKRVRDLFQLVDTVTSVFGSGTSYVALVNNRVGVLQIGEQFYTQTKALWTIGGKQPENYLSKIGARAIESQFHNIDFIGDNDYLIREAVNVVISDENFVNLQNSNVANLNGTNCELLRVEFYDYNKLAKITYKEPYNWAFNVKKVVVND
jgi:hypothetical protein